MRHRGPWVLLVLLLLGGVAWAQVVTYESITVAGTAVGIGTATLDPPAGGPIRECEWRLETAEIRYRVDGTNPTASEGMVLSVGDVLRIGRYFDAKQIRFIRTGATSGVLKGHCWR